MINNSNTYDWTAYLSMFLFGMLDNAWKSYENIIFGFEFDSKLTPFGANYFYECFAAFLGIASLSLWNLEK